MTRDDLRRTPAQWASLMAGGFLIVLGLFGFVVETSFATGDSLDRDEFLGVGVNGWANLIHLIAGLTLLAGAQTRPTAKSVSFVFAGIALLVAIIGIADGEEILGVMAVNGVANLIHLILALVIGGAAYVSPTTAGQQLRRKRERRLRKDPPPPPADETGPASASAPEDPRR